jgi:hypothetical protein
MLTRSVLGSVFVLLMAVVAMAGGCATGGDVVGPPSGPTPDGSSDAPETTCTKPQIKCGSTCVDPGSDHANCGGCDKPCGSGDVCSEGKCGLTCSGTQTLCSGAPYDGGVMMSESGAPETGTSDASGTPDAAMDAPGSDGAVDAAPHDAGHADAGKDAGKDAGPLVPYCANVNNDPKNCGACGKACAAGEMCDDGECTLTCKKGQKACPGNTGCAGPGECCTDSDCSTGAIGSVCPSPGGVCSCAAGNVLCPTDMTCIPTGTCCTDKDCTVTGETCPTPASMCACPSGQTPCTTSTESLCIPTGTCCIDTDCSVTGETCATPGGSCSCASGDTVCPTSNSCIASTACCTAGDCPPPPHVMTTSCTSGACGIAACDPGFVNIDGTYADGCECGDDAFGKSCATITNEGTVSLGQSVSVSGVLPLAGETDWFEVTFTDTTAATFHAKIALTTNPGAQFLFNVYDATCASTAMACADGGNSTAKTTWEISETDLNSPINTFPTVGSGGSVFVEVYRASGAPTCGSFTLTFSD